MHGLSMACATDNSVFLHIEQYQANSMHTSIVDICDCCSHWDGCGSEVACVHDPTGRTFMPVRSFASTSLVRAEMAPHPVVMHGSGRGRERRVWRSACVFRLVRPSRVQLDQIASPWERKKVSSSVSHLSSPCRVDTLSTISTMHWS